MVGMPQVLWRLLCGACDFCPCSILQQWCICHNWDVWQPEGSIAEGRRAECVCVCAVSLSHYLSVVWIWSLWACGSTWLATDVRFPPKPPNYYLMQTQLSVKTQTPAAITAIACNQSRGVMMTAVARCADLHHAVSQRVWRLSWVAAGCWIRVTPVSFTLLRCL